MIRKKKNGIFHGVANETKMDIKFVTFKIKAEYTEVIEFGLLLNVNACGHVECLKENELITLQGWRPTVHCLLLFIHLSAHTNVVY